MSSRQLRKFLTPFTRPKNRHALQNFGTAMAIFGHRTALEIASYADFLRGLSRVPAPLKSADLSGKT